MGWRRAVAAALVVAMMAVVAVLIWPEHAAPPAPEVTQLSAEPTPEAMHHDGRMRRTVVEGHAVAVPSDAGLIEGEVVHWGEGVENAALIFENSAGQHQVRRTDPAGQFSIRDLPEGRWRLTFISAEAFHDSSPDIDFDVTPLLAVRGLRFRLARGEVPIEVRTLDEVPIPGVEMTLTSNRFDLRPTGLLLGKTDAKGQLTLHRSPGDMIVMHCPGFRDAPLRTSAGFVAETYQELAVARMERLGEGFEARIRVLDQHGTPVNDAEVVAVVKNTDRSQDFADEFEHGRFDATPNGDGGYLLRVPRRACCRAEVTAFRASYDVADVDDEKEHVVEVVRPSSAIVAHVTDDAMRSVPNFAVILRREPNGFVSTSSVGGDGTLRLEVPPGQWTGRVSAPDFVDSPETSVTLTADTDARLDVILSRGRALSGKVVDRVTHRPIVGASIRGDRGLDAIEGFDSPGRAVTDVDGAFVLRALPKTRLQVSVLSFGYMQRSVVATPADTTLNIELSPSADDNGGNEWEGVGATLERCPDAHFFCVAAFVGGSGAKSAGLLEHDQILSVDGESVEGMSQDETINLIRGAEGTLVRLTVKRDSQTLDFTVVRRLLQSQE